MKAAKGDKNQAERKDESPFLAVVVADNQQQVALDAADAKKRTDLSLRLEKARAMCLHILGFWYRTVENHTTNTS
jgi:hypothetical protein